MCRDDEDPFRTRGAVGLNEPSAAIEEGGWNLSATRQDTTRARKPRLTGPLTKLILSGENSCRHQWRPGQAQPISHVRGGYYSDIRARRYNARDLLPLGDSG